MMRTKVIIFDVDGILFNTDEVFFSCLQSALQSIGSTIDEEFFIQHNYDDSLYHLGLRPDQIDSILQRLSATYYNDAILSHIQMKPSVHSVLDRLAPSFRLATGSGETKSQIQRYLRHFDLEKYFTFIGHGGLVEGRKGNPQYFQSIAKHYGVSPEECLHIGDTLTDQLALKAGVPVVIIPTKYSSHVTFDPRCSVLSNIEELPAFLEGKISALSS